MSATTDLSACGVATTYEAAGRRGLVDVPLIQIVPGSRRAGPARTVLCGQDDNLMVHASLDQVQPGEVLVITMPEPRPVGLIGELIATQAAHRQVAAVLLDAAVRDVEDVAALGIPIWSRWVRATGATKTAVGAIGVPVTIGGATVHSGDVVVLDADGAVVVAAGEVSSVAELALARASREARARARYREGELAYDLLGLRAVVEAAPPGAAR